MLRYLAFVAKNPKLLTTYYTGLVQNKAFRALKKKTNEILSPYRLSSTEWALLGLLYEEKQGIRSQEIAKVLDVEPPFVTVLLRNLKSKKFVTTTVDPSDSRAKIIMLDAAARNSVPKIEKILREQMKPLLKNVSTREILAYTKVIHTIVENSESTRDA